MHLELLALAEENLELHGKVDVERLADRNPLDSVKTSLQDKQQRILDCHEIKKNCRESCLSSRSEFEGTSLPEAENLANRMKS